MNLDFFASQPFIQTIAGNQKWTVSTKTKMPIDMARFMQENIIVGASFAGENQPLVSLPSLMGAIPNAANAAYNLKQAVDDFFILDIEPSCPPEVRDELLRLPYDYAELSMSRQGYHLAFRRPDPIPVTRPELFTIKPALRHENGWYEFLFNHYVTFTGETILPADGIQQLPIDTLWQLFDGMAEKARITKTFELSDTEIPDLEEIPLGEFIVDFLSDENAAYRKTADDFGGDKSKYEFGVTGFYFKRLNSLLSTTAYQRHDYTPQERIRILYEIITRMTPYRDKHEEIRDGMPWLMYTAKRVVTTVPDTNEKKEGKR